MTQPSVCLCSVVSQEFVQGAAVMVHSFIRHNQWFRDDIIFFAAGLENSDEGLLRKLSSNVRIQAAPSALVNRVDAAAAKRPDLRATSLRFLSCAAITLTAFDLVLFCDADLLFLGDVSAVFTNPSVLAACPDGPSLRGEERDPVTYKPVPATSDAPKQTFNSGFMVIRPDLVERDVWPSMLRLIDDFGDGEITSAHRDQVIYNLMFGGAWGRLDNRFNYLLGHHKTMLEHCRIPPSEATVLHFNGPRKPWNVPDRLRMSADPLLNEAAQTWSKAYLDMLEDIQPKRQPGGQ